MNNAARLEAVLFQLARPLSYRQLLNLLGWPESDLRQAIQELAAHLTERGINLINTGEELALGTNPALGSWLQDLVKAELAGPIGRAGLETLAIILYRGPVSRPEIDWIRGVNSTFIVRQLLVRGLIDRSLKTGDQRTYVYRPSVELLAQLGVSQPADLPDYHQFNQTIASAITHHAENGINQ